MPKKDPNVIIQVRVNLDRVRVSQRFIEVMYEIIAKNKRDVRNITDFCRILDINKQKISAIRSSSRDVMLEDVISLCREFNVSATYLISGIGDRYIS